MKKFLKIFYNRVTFIITLPFTVVCATYIVIKYYNDPCRMDRVAKEFAEKWTRFAYFRE